MSNESWIEAFADEDLAFMRRFLLASGSLKDLASEYGVSYPTIRLRLDRIIAKVKAFEGAEHLSPFERTLRMLIADGKIEPGPAARLLETYKSERAKEKSR